MRRSPRARRLAATAALLAPAFLLSGCFKSDLTLTVRADDTVDGSLVVALDKSMQSMTEGMGVQDAGFDEKELSALGIEATTRPYSDEKYVGQEMRFTGASLDAISKMFAEPGSGDTFSLTHVDGRYVFDATTDPMGETSSGSPDEELFPDAMGQALLADAEVTLSITFPGAVTKSNGTVHGHTVTWDLSLDGPSTLHAEAKEAGAFGRVSDRVRDVIGLPLGAVIGIVISALVVGGVGSLLWRRSRAGAAETLPPAPPEAVVAEGDETD